MEKHCFHSRYSPKLAVFFHHFGSADREQVSGAKAADKTGWFSCVGR